MRSKRYGTSTGQTRALQKLRPKLVQKQNNKCHWCNNKVKIYKDNQEYRPDEATLDHVVPRNEEGADCEDNIVIACRLCNQVRSGKLPPAKFRHLVMPAVLVKDKSWF